jgi:hypothetical protein
MIERVLKAIVVTASVTLCLCALFASAPSFSDLSVFVDGGVSNAEESLGEPAPPAPPEPQPPVAAPACRRRELEELIQGQREERIRLGLEERTWRCGFGEPQPPPFCDELVGDGAIGRVLEPARSR